MKSTFQFIDLPYVKDARGSLTLIEGIRHVPFEIKRIYYTYNVALDEIRVGHVRYQLDQVIFAVSGSFRILLDGGERAEGHWMYDPRKGLYLRHLAWRTMDDFSPSAVCTALASHVYDEADYIRDYT
jgi:hypothetical protein